MNLDQSIAEDLERIEEGYRDALPVIVKWRKMQRLLDEAIEQIKEKVIDELSNYPKSTAEIDGANLEVRSTAGRWNFKEISEWSMLEKKRKEIEEKAKEAYKLKLKGIEAFDNETGEILEAADYTAGKDTIFIKLGTDNIIKQRKELICTCDNPSSFKEMDEGRENCSKCKKPY